MTTGFSDKLSEIKAKQAAAEQKKKEEADKAAEATRLGREAKRSKLTAERETVMLEFAEAEQAANEAQEAITQADAFVAEQGENLDPGVSAEIDVLKTEAGEAQRRFEELKTKLETLNTEIAAFEKSEESQEISVEIPIEVAQEKKPAAKDAQQVEVEAQAENPIEKLRLDYGAVVEKIEAGKQKLEGLEKQRKELFAEKRKVERTGNTEKLEEIQKRLEENFDEEEGVKGGKIHELDKQFSKQRKPLIDALNKNPNYDERKTLEAQLEALNKQYDKEQRAQLEKVDENGLDGLKWECQRLVLEFKKRYGYDESLAQEADKKFGVGAARTDTNRVVLNNYLGLELPLISKDLKLRKTQKGEEVVNDDSQDGIFNRSLLVEKRLELMEQATRASETIKKIPKEQIDKILKEHKLDLAALKQLEYYPGTRDLGEHWQNKNISDIFTTYIHKQGSIYGDGELSSEASEKLKVYGGDARQLAFNGDYNSNTITNALFVHKIAKEKGLLVE